MIKTKLVLAVITCVLVLASARAAAAQTTIQGHLGRTVESGGWLIITSKGKYLIVNFRQFSKETWFQENTEVEATGEVKKGVITIYQEGIPFQVTSMQPINGSKTALALPSSQGLARVTVTGHATIEAQPDTVIIIASVVTQSARAGDAQQENARVSDAVVRAAKSSAGPEGEVKTSGYSLSPQYSYRQNLPPLIKGYEVRNSVTISTSDLLRTGPVIDALSAAGANDVSNISFILRHDQSARERAVAEATRMALAKARSMAVVLGGSLVSIVAVQESGTRPTPLRMEAAVAGVAQARAIATPVEAGPLEVGADVELTADIMAQP